MTGPDVQLPARWVAVADDLCAAVAAAFDETFGVPDRRPPVRLRHGTAAAFDQADIVFVSLARVLPVTDRAARCAVWPRGRFQIDLVRAWPTDPLLEHDTAAASMLLGDAAVVWHAISARCSAGALFPSVPTISCSDVTIGDLVPIEPQGGVAGWRFTVDVDLLL